MTARSIIGWIFLNTDRVLRSVRRVGFKRAGHLGVAKRRQIPEFYLNHQPNTTTSELDITSVFTIEFQHLNVIGFNLTDEHGN